VARALVRAASALVPTPRLFHAPQRAAVKLFLRGFLHVFPEGKVGIRLMA